MIAKIISGLPDKMSGRPSVFCRTFGAPAGHVRHVRHISRSLPQTVNKTLVLFTQSYEAQYKRLFCFSETFVYNFTHGYLDRHLKSTETRSSTCQNSNNQVCLHELTSSTFQSVVMDPEKVGFLCCSVTLRLSVCRSVSLE